MDTNEIEIDVLGDIINNGIENSLEEVTDDMVEEANGMEKLAKLAERVVRDHAQEVLADTDTKVIIYEVVTIIVLLIAIFLAWHCLGDGISELYTRERRFANEKSPRRVDNHRSMSPGKHTRR